MTKPCRSPADELGRTDGVLALIVAAGSLIGVVVCLFTGAITGNWGPEGVCWALLAISGIIGAALTDDHPPQPARWCPRCGRRHPLPPGPGCRR